MRYRKLSNTGDYTFGAGQLNFYINSPAAVGQAVKTVLLLWLGEWYLDITTGVPYLEGVLGKHSQDEADMTMKSQINDVQGVVNIASFQSIIDPVTRKYSIVDLVINTIYGQTQVELQNVGNF